MQPSQSWDVVLHVVDWTEVSTRPRKVHRTFRTRAASKPITAGPTSFKSHGNQLLHITSYCTSWIHLIVQPFSQEVLHRFVLHGNAETIGQPPQSATSQICQVCLATNCGKLIVYSCYHGCLKAHVNRSRARSRYRELHHDWIIVNTRIRGEQVNIFARIFLVQSCILRVTEGEKLEPELYKWAPPTWTSQSSHLKAPFPTHHNNPSPQFATHHRSLHEYQIHLLHLNFLST
jgi:hypothetical protein